MKKYGTWALVLVKNLEPYVLWYFRARTLKNIWDAEILGVSILRHTFAKVTFRSESMKGYKRQEIVPVLRLGNNRKGPSFNADRNNFEREAKPYFHALFPPVKIFSRNFAF